MEESAQQPKMREQAHNILKLPIRAGQTQLLAKNAMTYHIKMVTCGMFVLELGKHKDESSYI